MDDLFFNEMHYALKRDLENFLEKNFKPLKDKINLIDEFPVTLIQKIGKMGLFGTLISKKFKGKDLGLIAHCLITEEISKLNVAISVTRTPCILDGYLLNKYGNDYQKEKFLTKIAAGEKLCSICVTEEEAGSDVAGIKTLAKKKGNDYILQGKKKFITNAGLSDYYFIWAITNEKVNPRSGMSVFLVEKDTPGLEIENPYKLMGLSGLYNGIVNLKNVEVTRESLIGQEGLGFQSLMDTFNIERLTLSSECNGISLAALEDAKLYAKNRIQFNRPISSYQLIKLKIAKMATKLRAARMLTYGAAKLAEMNKDITKEASMAKAFSSKTAVKVTSEAVQIHGGDGYTDTYSVERYMRDAKFFQIGGGTSEIQNLIIAREELK